MIEEFDIGQLRSQLEDALARISTVENQLRYQEMEGEESEYWEEPTPPPQEEHHGNVVHPSFFDIYDIGTDTFKIKSNYARTEAGWFRGPKKTIADGAGMTWDSGGFWQSGSVVATNNVYLAFERVTVTTSIVMATTLPDGDGDTGIFPLWKIVWDIDHIASVSDERDNYNIPGMA